MTTHAPLMTLTDETHPDYPHLRRLVFTRDHKGWKAGDRGGWAERPANVKGDAAVAGNARVSGSALVSGDAKVSGDARVSGRARVSGNASITQNARVSDNALVVGAAMIYGNAVVGGSALVYGDSVVYGNAVVAGDARVSSGAEVGGVALVHRIEEVLVVSDVSTENQPATLFRTAAGHQIICGCWDGTTTELRELADSDRWPSGCVAATRDAHRPWLHAVADLFDARITMWRNR